MASSELRDFLDAITVFVPADPDKKRYLIVGVYSDPFINERGKYDHHHKWDKAFVWPDEADEAVAHIEFHAAGCDVYVCPYLMNGKHRDKHDAAWRQLIHSDADSGDADELRAKVRKLGGFIVWSGTPGHGHAYVPLSYTVRQVQHEALCEGLRDYLGGDDKIRASDLLRPPGTFNYKPTLAGLPPALVKVEKL